MDAASITILVANMAMGLAGALVLARQFGRVRPGAVRACFVMFLGIYLVESFAVAASMMTMVLPIVLAFLWPRLISSWLLKSWAPAEYPRKVAREFAVYTGLPALSAVLMPVVAGLCVRNIISTAGGESFGIPSFLPWPLNSILGFFGAVSVVTFVLKVIITTRGMHDRLDDGQDSQIKITD